MAILIASLVVALVILFFAVKQSLKVNKEKKAIIEETRQFKEKYQPILDIEAEVQKKKDEHSRLTRETSLLSDRYRNARQLFEQLESQIKLYESDLDIMDFGVYTPSFDYETSAKFKQEITLNKERQKITIQNNNAATCDKQWTVEGSLKKGEQMTKRGIKLALRAFNGECDSIISKVKWNNVAQAQQKIQRAFDAINKLNKSNEIYITQGYLNLKLEELNLTHEYEVKKNEEKEEQRRIREQIREEDRVKKEIEKAQKDAEKEELQYQKAIEKAQRELQKVQGEELEKLNEELAKLQAQLQEAQEAKERAVSMAQRTKSGHVYVISNIGSFGENVYKIGMTRRLEPMDRVKELGDASVPFQFDVHAMIYSENAPELENTLHKVFNEKRVNMINSRKEYFHTSLTEIEEAVKECSTAEIEFTKIAEAKEYRETLSLRKNLNKEVQGPEKEVHSEYPESLF